MTGYDRFSFHGPYNIYLHNLMEHYIRASRCFDTCMLI